MVSRRLTLVRTLRSPVGIEGIHKEVNDLCPTWNNTLFLWQALWSVGKRTIPAVNPNQQLHNLIKDGAAIIATFVPPKPGDLYVDNYPMEIGVVLAAPAHPDHIVVVNHHTPKPIKKKLDNIQFFLQVFT